MKKKKYFGAFLMKYLKGQRKTMILLAVFNILLNKLGGQEDIIVGTVTAGRGHADLQPLIGMFVDTLALRNFPKGEKTFQQFLKEVKKVPCPLLRTRTTHWKNW